MLYSYAKFRIAHTDVLQLCEPCRYHLVSSGYIPQAYLDCAIEMPPRQEVGWHAP
jgi:hypothetical protein